MNSEKGMLNSNQGAYNTTFHNKLIYNHNVDITKFRSKNALWTPDCVGGWELLQ